MNGLFVLAQAAGATLAESAGVSLTGLIGSLGASAAAVTVTYYFLNFLKDQAAKQGRMLQEFKDSHAESQKKLQDQVDRLTDRHLQSQRTFQDQISRITDAQSILLREAVLAMKSVEKTLESSTETIRIIEKTTASLQSSIMAIDDLVRTAHDSKAGSNATAALSPQLRLA
jgi:hypothetical protein